MEADAKRTAAWLAQGVVSKQVAEQSRTSVTTLKAQLESARKQAEASKAQLACRPRSTLTSPVVRALWRRHHRQGPRWRITRRCRLVAASPARGGHLIVDSGIR